LADYWQKTVDKTVEKWRFSEVDYSSAYNDFGGRYNAPNHPNGGIIRGCAFVSLIRGTPRRD
jgi:hypothetical protein